MFVNIVKAKERAKESRHSRIALVGLGGVGQESPYHVPGNSGLRHYQEVPDRDRIQLPKPEMQTGYILVLDPL